MNILKIQDNLKNLSDEQLAQEMRLPSGTAPQYLVMTEMQRREKMRAEFSGSEPPKTTMAEEMSGEAPPPQGGMPPDGSQDANAQGLMGMPDETMAGNAMRARISGQPQQIDGMTALPPQAMAAGGAVQFGSPFAGAQMGDDAVQFGSPFAGAQMGPYASSTSYAPIQHYTYTPPPPPQVHTVKPTGRGPAGGSDRGANMGRPTLNRGPIRKASDGGPIYAAGGMYVMPYSPAADTYGMMSNDDLIDAASSKDPSVQEPAAAEMNRRNEQTRLGRLGGSVGRGAAKTLAAVNEFAPDVLPFIAAPIPMALRLGLDYLSQPAEPLQVPGLSGRDIPGAAGAMSRYRLPSDAGQAGLAAPEDIGRGANAPVERPMAADLPRRIAPMSAPVSGPSDKAEKGIASLPPGPKGMTYEDYMRQANELIGGSREDEKTAKDRAFNNALMQLGLGMASSKNQSTLGAIAEGGIPALQGYSEAEAQRRKDDRALVGERLATLGVGAQMSQAEAKAADERAYRAEQATIQKDEIAARREDARMTAAYRDRDNDLKRMQIDAQIWANKNPAKIIEWKARFGEERGVEIGSQYEALTDLAKIYNDQYQEAARLAKDTQTADDVAAAKTIFDKLTATSEDIKSLSRFGQSKQSSTTPTKPPPSQYSIPGTR